MNGFKEVSVKFVDYEDEHHKLRSHPHFYLKMKKSKYLKRKLLEGESKVNYSPRATRHFSLSEKNERINVSLDSLKKGKNIDVENFIANTTLQDEIDHNKKYLSEIENEFDELIRYMEEIRQTKNYLKNQILMMRKNSNQSGFFSRKISASTYGTHHKPYENL